MQSGVRPAVRGLRGFSEFLLKAGVRAIARQPNHNSKGRRRPMPNKDFEVQQLLRAYRKGVISEELFAQHMNEIVESKDGMGAAVPNVFAHRGDGAKMSRQMLGTTLQTD